MRSGSDKLPTFSELAFIGFVVVGRGGAGCALHEGVVSLTR